jgi:hypothetical protein
VASSFAFSRTGTKFLRWFSCSLVVGLFTWIVSLYYIPGKGFTYLIEFGAANRAMFLPEVKAVNHFEFPNASGYDGQWYAQIAMHPRLADRVLSGAVDTLPYRVRRILFEWTAWAIGGGNPTRTMNVFAFQNVACWYVLAALLFRWFPPVCWGNCFRWAAVLFSFGLIFSVKGALLDGPSLLLIAVGMALIESRCPWWGAFVLGISGLGKETNVLGGSALSPSDARLPRAWATWLAQIVFVLLPVVLWAYGLTLWIGKGTDTGTRNFSGILTGVSHKALEAVSSLMVKGNAFSSEAMLDFLVLVGLLAQLSFFAFRIRWRELWWRMGASYGVLLLFLGDPVWEGYPSAAPRVLLPMTLAFNVLVPRGGWWPLLLVVGNLGIFGSADLLRLLPPDRLTECFVVEGPREMRINAANGFDVVAVYGPRNWRGPESERMTGKKSWDSWRWSMGDCTITIHNPQPFAMLANVSFGLATVDARKATVKIGGRVVWSDILKPAHDNQAAITGIELSPGDTELLFQSDRPAVSPGNGDNRRFTFSVRDLEIDLVGRR